MHHVIVGAGPAGVIAAESLRRLDSTAAVTSVGDEPEPPYSRMAIPYYLYDQIKEEGTYLRKEPGYFGDQGIEVMQDRVTAIDPASAQLNLASGDTCRYDRLLLATGSRPMTPPIEGTDLPGVHQCWTLKDARAIRELAAPGSRVVLMGAGFIGCIILEALAERKVDLTVVEMQNRMVPRMMNEQSGGLIKSWCEAKGVTVLTSTPVSGISQEGQQLSVALESGDVCSADLIIMATGVRPNLELLEGVDIDTDIGIMVDQRLQTSVDGIFAAGDVAQGRDFSTGEYSIQAVQPTAVEHGRIAASNMAGGDGIVHRGSLNMNVLDTMGLVSTSFGAWQGVEGGESAELNDPANFRYLNLQFQDDVLVGANTLGMTQHIGVLRGLIQTGVRLGAWKDRLLNNPLHLMEAYVAATQGVGVTAKALD